MSQHVSTYMYIHMRDTISQLHQVYYKSSALCGVQKNRIYFIYRLILFLIPMKILQLITGILNNVIYDILFTRAP